MNFSKTAERALPKEPAYSEDVHVDLLWVEKVQAGNVAAFDVLVKKYRERIYGSIYNLVANREDAADLTQEVLIKTFQNIRKFQKKSSFSTWIYRIAVNTALGHMRKNRLRQFFSFEQLDKEANENPFVERLASKFNTSKATLLKELQEKLNESLQKLSIKHRTVIVLYEIEGLTHQEIGNIVGCSEGTVRSRLHYAKQQLQHELSEYLK